MPIQKLPVRPALIWAFGALIEATAVYERTFPELTLKLKKGMAGLPYEGIFEKRPE